jgi:hypothetical protein
MNRIRTIAFFVIGGFWANGCSQQNLPAGLVDEPVFDQSGTSSSVIDPVGDATFRQNTGPGSAKKVPDWLDITGAEISKQGQTFVLTMALAGALTTLPEASGGFGVYQWGWGLETDLGTAPAGTPFPSSDPNLFEFFILLDWDGSAFQAIVMDRRPLLSGGEAILTPVEFSVTGTTIRLSVPQRLLGNPTAFDWAAFTDIRHAHYGNEGFDILDGAPDASLAQWPG